MSTLGNVISRHKTNFDLMIVAYGMGGLFVLCGIGLFSLNGAVGPQGKALAFGAALGATLIGGMGLAGGWWLGQGNVVVLCAEGVRVESRNGMREYAFSEVQETCQMYRSGVPVGLAFQAKGQPGWESVNGHLSGFRAFRDGFINAFLAQRIPLLLDAIQRGTSCTFKYLPIGGRIAGMFVTGIHDYAKLETNLIQVDREAIRFQDGSAILLARLAGIEYAFWTDRLHFVLIDGTVTSIKMTALFDSELFIALVEAMRGVPSPQAS